MRAPASSIPFFRGLLLAFLACAVFLSALGRRDIVTSHEARVALTAREMAASGWPWNARPAAVPPVKLVKDGQGITRFLAQWEEPPIHVNPWMVPVIGNEIRLQKPPLPYWCAALLFRAARVPWSEGLARLIPAMLGALSMLLLFALTDRILGRTAAWAASLVWVSSYFIAEQFRLAMADPYLAFFTLLAAWAWVRERTIVFYVTLGLGTLAKGPLFVPLVAFVAAYHYCFRGRRPPRGWWAHALGVVIVLAMVLPWVVYVYRHVPNVLAVWKYESAGELAGGENVEKARPFWFYAVNLFQITLPWTPIWIVGCVLPFVRGRGTRRQRRRRLFAVAWYFATVAFFSLLMSVKKNTYLLPVMPAQAMITAQGLVAVAAVVRRFPRSAILAWVQAGIGVAGAIAAVALCTLKMPAGHRAGALAFSIVGCAAAIGAAVQIAARRPRAWMCLQAAAYSLVIVAVFNFWRADEDNRRSAAPVCGELTAIMDETGETLAPAKRPEEAALYLPLHLPLGLNAKTMLTIVDDPKHTSKSDPGRFADRVPWRKVVAADRVPMKTAPGEGARWKVYRLTLD